MKSAFLVAWLMLHAICTSAQATAPAALPLNAQSQKVEFSQVVPVDGVSQAELYTRAKIWAAKTYTSAQNVIKADEKDAGLLIIKATTAIPMNIFKQNVDYDISYTLTLGLKDGRYKYTLTDYVTVSGQYETPLEVSVGPEMRQTKRGTSMAQQYESGIEAHARQLAASLNEALKSNTHGTDW